MNKIFGLSCGSVDIRSTMGNLIYSFPSNVFLNDNQSKKPQIRTITANEEKKIVTVVFNDGEVQMSKCSAEDYFDINVGVAMCIAYHNFGSKTQMHKFIEKTAKIVKKKSVSYL